MAAGSGALAQDDLGGLVAAGTSVVSDLDLDRTARAVADAARELCSATFAVLLHDGTGGSGPLRRLARSGIRREDLEASSALWSAPSLAPAIRGQGSLRLDELGSVPGSPPGASSAVVTPVASSAGEVVGVLAAFHPRPGHFDRRHELVLEGLARFAAVGLANAREFRVEQEIARELQQAMLPDIGFHEGVEIAVRYRPAPDAPRSGATGTTCSGWTTGASR